MLCRSRAALRRRLRAAGSDRLRPASVTGRKAVPSPRRRVESRLCDNSVRMPGSTVGGALMKPAIALGAAAQSLAGRGAIVWLVRRADRFGRLAGVLLS